jgi:hypothetical protein
MSAGRDASVSLLGETYLCLPSHEGGNRLQVSSAVAEHPDGLTFGVGLNPVGDVGSPCAQHVEELELGVDVALAAPRAGDVDAQAVADGCAWGVFDDHVKARFSRRSQVRPGVAVRKRASISTSALEIAASSRCSSAVSRCSSILAIAAAAPASGPCPRP